MKSIIIFSILFFIVFSSFQTKPLPGIKASIERGKKVYAGTCMACHQADALGVQRMNPPLVKTKWVLGDKKALAKIVLNGLKGGEIEIDGDDFHNPMPPQATQLTDQQIADALTYIRNNFGNKASAVTVADVKAARGKAAAPATVTKKPATKTPVKKPPVKH
jgi:mono/diheme cytochrome c family protein